MIEGSGVLAVTTASTSPPTRTSPTTARSNDAFAGARTPLEGLLAEGSAEGAFDVRDPAVTASFLLHGLHGVLVEVLHGGPERRRQAAATARHLVRNTVRP